MNFPPNLITIQSRVVCPRCLFLRGYLVNWNSVLHGPRHIGAATEKGGEMGQRYYLLDPSLLTDTVTHTHTHPTTVIFLATNPPVRDQYLPRLLSER